MMAPQRSWHGRVITRLTVTLDDQAPDGVEVDREMTIRLDARTRLEADIVVSSARYDPDRTFFEPGQVLLSVEVVSPESAFRDRTVKLRKYAAAGIRHYWLVEDEATGPVVHVYELDEPTKSYAPTGVFRDALHVQLPFETTSTWRSSCRAGDGPARTRSDAESDFGLVLGGARPGRAQPCTAASTCRRPWAS